MGDLLIRAATPENIGFLKRCAHAAYTQYIAAIGRPPAPMLADFAAQIASGQVFIAEKAQPLGYVVFFPAEGYMHLEAVGVLPEAAGQGIGGALIRFCEDTARQQGLREVRLYTNAAMTANLSLYPYLGYTETGRRREDGFDRVFFAKVLTSSGQTGP